MALFEKLGLKERVSINWNITPTDTFGIFESWGGKERVRTKSERFYYFYIDNWTPPAKLFLMERGIKFARVLAQIDAPQEMIDACVAGQGKGMLDKSYAIDDALKQWLKENILAAGDDSKVIPVDSGIEQESLETDLPGKNDPVPKITVEKLRVEPIIIVEEQVGGIVKKHNFFDSQYNPAGKFENYLVDNGDSLTVTDLKTGVMWQRGGCDITTIKQVQLYVQELNQKAFAGFADWRLPTMDEALSLFEPVKNAKGLHLHPCFSMEQPFIFLADQRKPGGYWFADFKQATIFWASGTIPGAFGRVCRTVK